MNLVILPILAAVILALGYRTLGRLISTLKAQDREYITAPAASSGAHPSRPQTGVRFATLGTPLLLAGAAFGVRYGWAPVFLWVLLAATTAGGLSIVRRFEPRARASPARRANTILALFLGAALALLFAGIAARFSHIMLAFLLLYAASPRLSAWLARGGLERVIGGLATVGLALLGIVLGRWWPIGVSGRLWWALGPLHVTIESGEIVFFALAFLALWPAARARTLQAQPAAGTVGTLLLALTGGCVILGTLLMHPSLSVPRLAGRGLLPAVPLLATALPFGAALLPFPATGTPVAARDSYRLALFEAAAAIGVVVCMAAAFPAIRNWHAFFATAPGAVAVLHEAARGSGVLTAGLGLGPDVPALFLVSLLLLLATSFESTVYHLVQSSQARLSAPARPLAAIAAVGALWWLVGGLASPSLLLAGGFLGLAAIAALVPPGEHTPGFVVSLSLIWLVPIDIALAMIGRAGVVGHPLRTATAAALLITEVAWIVWLMRTRSRPKEHASSRRPRNQP